MKFQTLKFSDLSYKLWEKVSSLTIPDSGLTRYYNYFLDAIDDNDQERQDKNDLSLILVSDPDLCAWSMVGMDQDYYDGQSAVIYLFIKKSHRQQGLGIDLLSKALEVCSKQGFKKFNVYAHDPSSKAFFESRKAQELVNKSNLTMAIIEN